MAYEWNKTGHPEAIVGKDFSGSQCYSPDCIKESFVRFGSNYPRWDFPDPVWRKGFFSWFDLPGDSHDVFMGAWHYGQQLGEDYIRQHPSAGTPSGAGTIAGGASGGNVTAQAKPVNTAALFQDSMSHSAAYSPPPSKSAALPLLLVIVAAFLLFK